MRELIWRLIASIVIRPKVFARLLQRGWANPYEHIGAPDNRYMERYWLFNPYTKDANGNQLSGRWDWLGLPSIRLHHIMRPDADRHLHDHPWDARTIVCRQHYVEERQYRNPWTLGPNGADSLRWVSGELYPRDVFTRRMGYTGRLRYGEYHRISEIPEGGVWTLFFTWKFRGEWGFDVDGTKVPHTEYLKKNSI